MQLKPFEAGRYDDASIVVANPANGKQELFSEREYAIVKFLKQNETQSLLALLMPNIGISKRTHVETCLRVLGKLKRMQVVDYFAITGRKPSSNTATMDMASEKARLGMPGLDAFAAVLFGVAGRILSSLGQAGLFGAVVAPAALAFLFFPFDRFEEALAESPPRYLLLLLLAWLAACAAFSARSLVQAAFLRVFGREARSPSFVFFPPLLALSADCREANLLGFKARAQMGALGMIAPLAFGSLFTLLAALRLMDPLAAFISLSACAGASLALACPLLPLDGADVLQALAFRGELERTLDRKLRDVLTAGAVPCRSLGFAAVLAFAWLAVWLDSLAGFRGLLAARLAEDVGDPWLAAGLGAGCLIGVLLALALLPFGVLLFHASRRRGKARRKMVVPAEKLRDSLTFEERIAALEKIPLFANLNDQERLSLLNEMQPAFYMDGDFLMHQGELGREFFVLVKGHASAFHTDSQGNSLPLAELAEGDAFGEVALIDDVPRTASIVSEGGCIALVLRKEGFQRFADSMGSPDRVKAMVRLTSFFRRHPLFSKLGPRDQAQLIDSFRFQVVTAGETIPDRDESFHVVYSGRVRVDTGGAEGETDLRSDDCFGYSNPLNARYVALEGTGLLTVAKDQFHNLIWEKLVEKPELFV